MPLEEYKTEIAHEAIYNGLQRTSKKFNEDTEDVRMYVYETFNASYEEYQEALAKISTKEKIESLGYTYIEGDLVQHKNSGVTLLCPEGHLIITKTNFLLNNPNKTKYVCSACSNKRKITQEQVEREAEAVGLKVLGEYKGYFKKMPMVCEHGHHFDRAYSELVSYKRDKQSRQGRLGGCPICNHANKSKVPIHLRNEIAEMYRTHTAEEVMEKYPELNLTKENIKDNFVRVYGKGKRHIVKKKTDVNEETKDIAFYYMYHPIQDTMEAKDVSYFKVDWCFRKMYGLSKTAYLQVPNSYAIMKSVFEIGKSKTARKYSVSHREVVNLMYKLFKTNDTATAKQQYKEWFGE